MSFILDALKKSENERQRTVGPSLADAPTRRYQPERPWWVVAVAALLIINIGVLAFVLMRKSDVPAQTPIATPAAAPVPVQAPTPAATAPAARQQAPTSPAVRSLAEEAGTPADGYYEGAPGAVSPEEMAAHPDLAAAANVPGGPPIVQPVNPPAVAPLSARAAQEARNAAHANFDEVLPTANALAASGTSIPEMRLDIHVYSNNPAERFVFINMRKYTEGQTLTEGPALERITPEGAVLNQRGLRFLLPRQ